MFWTLCSTLLQWVEVVRHTPCSCSDHYYVDLIFQDFDLEKMQYGPGYWKCNVTVLNNVDFKLVIEKLWNSDLVLSDVEDGEWWENCKQNFKA